MSGKKPLPKRHETPHPKPVTGGEPHPIWPRG